MVRMQWFLSAVPSILLFCFALSWAFRGLLSLPEWRGGCFRRQEGCNASAVAELIYLSCSSDIVQMPSSDLTQLLLNGLRGPDQRQPPCTAAESYPCECACLHMERGLLLKGPPASSLPGEELRSHRQDKLRPRLNHTVCRSFNMPRSHSSSFSISRMNLEYVVVPFSSSH